MTITNHKLVGAVDAPSPNQSGAITPKFVVMHYTASWNAGDVVDTFANPASQVSAQITIDTDGTVYQHVPFNKKAWHAGPSAFGGYSGLNSHSIGIELVNPGYLRKQGDGSLTDWAKRKAPAGIEVLEAEHSRVGSGTFYWPFYSDAQLDAAEKLVAELIEEYGIIDIVTHEEIDQRGWKTDPGPAFPMNRFRALLKDRANEYIPYQTTASTLNVRSGPGTNFNVLFELKEGQSAVELDRRGDWVRISNDGWVHSAYLQRLG